MRRSMIAVYWYEQTDEERLRLEGIYSAMSDEELGRIADSGDELSKLVAEAFQAEIARRGLTAEAAPPPGEDRIRIERYRYVAPVSRSS